MFKELESQEYKIQLHKQFWDRESQAAPILSFKHSDFFLARDFKASGLLNIDGLQIRPNMLVVEDFLPDYEIMYQESPSFGQSVFWTAGPFTAILWMEAILGCPVIGGSESLNQARHKPGSIGYWEYQPEQEKSMAFEIPGIYRQTC